VVLPSLGAVPCAGSRRRRRRRRRHCGRRRCSRQLRRRALRRAPLAEPCRLSGRRSAVSGAEGARSETAGASAPLSNTTRSWSTHTGAGAPRASGKLRRRRRRLGGARGRGQCLLLLSGAAAAAAGACSLPPPPTRTPTLPRLSPAARAVGGRAACAASATKSTGAGCSAAPV
jgi:hypothetical protein